MRYALAPKQSSSVRVQALPPARFRTKMKPGLAPSSFARHQDVREAASAKCGEAIASCSKVITFCLDQAKFLGNERRFQADLFRKLAPPAFSQMVQEQLKADLLRRWRHLLPIRRSYSFSGAP